jgi:hypothetical protein
VIAAKLIAALASAGLLLVPPVVVCVAFALAGGHLDATETAVAFLGHALHLAVIACVSVAAAAACRSVAQATVVALVASLASWAIDASDGFSALAWLGALDWVSVARKLAPFEQGIIHVGAGLSLVVLASAAAAIAFVLGDVARRARHRALAGSIALCAVLALWRLDGLRRGYDRSELGRQSLPPAVVEALRTIPEPIELEVWLDRDDGRRWQLEHDALAKVVLARPDTVIAMPLDHADAALAEHDAGYGRVVVHAGGTRETRSTSSEELVTQVLAAAGAPPADWTHPDYPGYPLVVAGHARAWLIGLAYLFVPGALALAGFVVIRSRRRT